MKSAPVRTAATRERVLAALRFMGRFPHASQRLACQAAGVDSRVLCRLRDSNDEVNARWRLMLWERGAAHDAAVVAQGRERTLSLSGPGDRLDNHS